ncbi:MAG: M56 family metallopeptidase, partial [Bdellovibrionota bacterium]
MKTIELLAYARPYLETNALMLLGLVCLLMVNRLVVRFRPAQAHLLPLGRALLIASLIFPIFASFVPEQVLLRPAVQVWSGMSHANSAPYALLSTVGQNTSAKVSPDGVTGLKIQNGMVFGSATLFIFGFLISLFRLTNRMRKLRSYLDSLPVIKKIGSVSILASGEGGVAFSAWFPGRAFVVLPSSLFMDPRGLRIVLRHEIQHHKQGDTRWVHFLAFVKAVFFWNPAIYAWGKLLSEVQEFACDEILIGRRNVSALAYGRCLLQAAESAVGSRVLLAGTTGMATSASGN